MKPIPRVTVPCLLVLAAHAQVSPGPPVALPLASTAPYEGRTNDRVEFTNFHPEPFAGLAFDVDGGILAVNPYNNTFVKYASPTASSLALRAQTGHAPVSIGVWNPGPAPADRRIVVVCTGSHAMFLHAPDDGRVLNVLLLDSEPADLAIDGEHGWAFVSCRGDNTVLKVDLPTFQVLERYPIGCGRRPGPLYLDTGLPGDPNDTRVYVAPMVTGNDSAFGSLPGMTIGVVVDLDQAAPADHLPDEDVFRIDPFQSGASAVAPVVKRAGSLIFELARHPNGKLWLLSTDSNNKSPTLDTEPELQGQIVTNQLVIVDGVNGSSGLVTAGAGIDLDDTLPPSNPSPPVYSSAHSLNQARTLAFQPDGDAFAASPMSDVIAELHADGARFAELALPHRAQCYALAAYPPNPQIVLALCLGTMTIEVFTEGNPQPGRALPLGQDPTPVHVRAGRDIVLDGQISQDGRSSCFACHEGGRTDMLGWSIAAPPGDLKDVMVTQTLLSIADTFPHHWRGERDLDDFRKAFVGLLGAPEALAPTPAQMQDVNAFLRSLKAPANPLESFQRVVDDSQTPGPAPNGASGSAVLGQKFFKELQNFNGDTCAECHSFATGSNANMFAEVKSSAPRVLELEVPHLRQLQVKGLDTFTLSNGAKVNENGFGATHNGHEASVFEFLMNNFPQLSPLQLVQIFFFVLQFDQGLAPGAHWVTWYSQAKPAAARDIEAILVNGADQGWLDLVAFGRFDDGTGPREVRWLYDPAQKKLVNDDPVVGDKTWLEFQAATQAGKAENAFMGVPLGNGFRIAFDPDADDARTGDELAGGTNPWARDTDRDGWPDGYELENGENPLVPQANPGDDFSPALLDSRLEFASARAAKYQVRFSEDVTYVVTYGLPSGPQLSYEQRDFVRADTFVLTHSAPSTPILSALNKPAPDGTTVFSASITMTDRAGKVVGPVPLAQTFTPLAAQQQPPFKLFMHVGGMSAVVTHTGPSSLSATVTLAPELHYGAPDYFDGDGTVAFCNIAVQDPVTKKYAQSSSFTTSPPLPTGFSLTDPAGGPPIPYTATPGPFVMCPLTQNGTTQFTFQQGGLVPGQKVKIAVQGILIPDDLANQVYDPGTLVLLQPLLTEDAHELEITF